MSNWNYDLEALRTSISDDLYKIINTKWTNIVSLERDIREQTLRQVMSNLTNKKVKDTFKKIENRHTPRFRTFHILGKKVEDVVQVTTKLWKKFFKWCAP